MRSSNESSLSTRLPKRPYSDSHRFSIKLRRRFSRERRTKSIHLPLKKPDRQNGGSLFSLSQRFSRATPASTSASAELDDLGDGLTSERGYDSDAQYISSPRNMTLSPSSVVGRSVSPLAHGYARTELSDLSERSHERLVDGLDTIVDRRGEERPRESSPLRGDLEDASCEEVHHIDWCTLEGVAPEDVDQPVHEDEVEASASPAEQQGECQTRDTTTELWSSEPSGSDAEGSGQRPTIPPFPENLPAARGSDHLETTDTKTSDSMTGHSSEIIVTKRRQQSAPCRSLSESRSVHLGDMNIPQALASLSLMSPSTTPHMSQSQSVDENRREDMPRTRSILEDSGAAKLQLNQNPDERASIYSPISSVSSAQPAHHQPPKTWGFRAIEKYLTKLDRQTTSSRSLGLDGSPSAYHPVRFKGVSESNAAESSSAPATQALKSKFIEKFDKDSSSVDQGAIPSEAGDGQTPPRKVSAGWMSGGRRVGYGYNMVDPDKENTGSRVKLDAWGGGSRSNSGTAYGSTASIPSMITHLGERHLSGTTASLTESTAKEATDGDSNAARTWAKVADRVKGRNSSVFGAVRTIPGHWPVFGSEQGSESQHKRRSILDKDGNLFRRMSRIYSSNSLQARRRNATENIHDIKERVSAKAAGIYHPLLQKKASGDIRLRVLGSGYNKGRKGVVNVERDNDALKNCGWTRESRSSAWLAGDLSAAAVSDAARRDRDGRKALGQNGSDDTTEDLVYQDCMEVIPGSDRS